MESVFKEAKKKMEASLEHFKKEISKLRTGRASAAIFEEIKVEYYGAPTPITQLATINIINPELVIIQPWDKNVVAEIEKAIIRSNLGLNPVNEGTQLKIPIPPLDEEFIKKAEELAKKKEEDILQV